MVKFNGGSIDAFIKDLLKHRTVEFTFTIPEDRVKKIVQVVMQRMSERGNPCIINYFSKPKVNSEPVWVFTIDNLDTNRKASVLLKSDQYGLS